MSIGAALLAILAVKSGSVEGVWGWVVPMIFWFAFYMLLAGMRS